VAAVSLRYFNVYGPGQDPASEYAAVVPIFITRCLTGRPVEIHGDGTQARDFTYVDDVVDATILASRAPEAGGGVINVGGGATPTSVDELLSRIASLVGSEPEIVRRPPRGGDVTITQADLGRARRLLGYRPRVSIDEGLRRTVAWFRTPVEARPSSVAASPVTR
jgi:nucleoside-diphosphate-sugar epimerase